MAHFSHFYLGVPRFCIPYFLINKLSFFLFSLFPWHEICSFKVLIETVQFLSFSSNAVLLATFVIWAIAFSFLASSLLIAVFKQQLCICYHLNAAGMQHLDAHHANIIWFSNIHCRFLNISDVFSNTGLYQNDYSKPTYTVLTIFQFPQQPSIWHLHHRGTWRFRLFLKLE